MKPAPLIVTVFLSTLLYAQPRATENQQQVQQTVINFFESLSSRDSIGLTSYCTNDIILFENGKIWNADTLILKAITLNTATDFKRSNAFDFISTTVKRNIAWATYNLYSVMTRNGNQTTVHWMETIIAIKEKNRWKIKVLHSTLIKRS